MNIPSRSWLTPKAEVKKSPIDNLGLFTKEKIKKDEVVAILGGITITDEEVDQAIKSGNRYDGISVDNNLNLSILPNDWPGIYGNHSCDPNTWMKDAVTIVARQDIQKGEELTSDYATNTISSTWIMQCNCGSNLCRKTITGNDWKLPALQERYKGHFAPVIEKLINRVFQHILLP